MTVRLAALNAFIALLTQEITETVVEGAGVEVLTNVGSTRTPAEGIYVYDVTGNVEPAALAGQADAATDDDFTVSMLLRAGRGGQDPDTAMARADELYQAVRNVVLGREHGHDLGNRSDVPIAFLTLGGVDGPIADPEQNTYVGLYRVDVRIVTDEVTA